MRTMDLVALVSITISFAGLSGGDPEGPVTGRKDGSPKAAGEEPKKADTLGPGQVIDAIRELMTPATLKALPDGRIRLTVNCVRGNFEDSRLFDRRVDPQTDRTSPFKRRLARDGRGIRVSSSGQALLNICFKDDVEAEVLYHHKGAITDSMTISLMFTNFQKRALHGVCGCQAVSYNDGVAVEKDGQTPALEPADRLKLVMKDGSFEAWKNGKLKGTVKYPQSEFSSGRVGIVWGGSITGFVQSITITGRMDCERTMRAVEELRKGQR